MNRSTGHTHGTDFVVHLNWLHSGSLFGYNYTWWGASYITHSASNYLSNRASSVHYQLGCWPMTGRPLHTVGALTHTNMSCLSNKLHCLMNKILAWISKFCLYKIWIQIILIVIFFLYNVVPLYIDKYPPNSY